MIPANAGAPDEAQVGVEQWRAASLMRTSTRSPILRAAPSHAAMASRERVLVVRRRPRPRDRGRSLGARSQGLVEALRPIAGNEQIGEGRVQGLTVIDRLHGGRHTACAARSSAISALVSRASARIASVCSPSAGTGSMRGIALLPKSLAAASAGIGPAGDVDLAPAFACGELRMLPDVVHVVDPRIRDLRLVEPIARPPPLSARAKRATIMRAQLVARGAALGVAGEARLGRKRPAAAAPFAEHRPLALVLQAEHHHLAVAGRERPVGIDRRVARAGARRRRRAVECVVQRDSSSTRPATRASRCRGAARARSAAALQQRRENVACTRTCRRRCRRSTARPSTGLPRCRSPTGSPPRSGSAGRTPFCRDRALLAVAGDVADDDARASSAAAPRRTGRAARRRRARDSAPRRRRARDQPPAGSLCASGCLTSSVRLSFERLVQTKCEARPRTRSS